MKPSFSGWRESGNDPPEILSGDHQSLSSELLTFRSQELFHFSLRVLF